jgi:hypothetical protein
LRDRGDKRALHSMWQGDGGVATASSDIPGKPELMSAVGPKQRFGLRPPTVWFALHCRHPAALP